MRASTRIIAECCSNTPVCAFCFPYGEITHLPYRSCTRAANDGNLGYIHVWYRIHGTHLDCACPVVEKKAYLSHQFEVHLVACRQIASFFSPGAWTTDGIDRRSRRPAPAPTKTRRRYVRAIGSRDLELLPQSLQAHRHPPQDVLLRCSLRRPLSQLRQTARVVISMLIDVGVGVCGGTSGAAAAVIPTKNCYRRWSLLMSPILLLPPLGR